jgi:hypothetical protein
MTQKLLRTGITILALTAACAATWVWGAGYESDEKWAFPIM